MSAAHESNLIEAKIEAVNRCHSALNFAAPLAIQLFEPFVGKKILRKDSGQLILPARSTIYGFCSSVETNQTTLFFDHAGGLLKLNANARAPIKGHPGRVHYHEAWVLLGFLHGTTLARLVQPKRERDDWSFEAVTDMRGRLARAEAIVSQLRAELSDFESFCH